jgi:hypothetical protein
MVLLLGKYELYEKSDDHGIPDIMKFSDASSLCMQKD